MFHKENFWKIFKTIMKHTILLIFQLKLFINLSLPTYIGYNKHCIYTTFLIGWPIHYVNILWHSCYNYGAHSHFQMLFIRHALSRLKFVWNIFNVLNLPNVETSFMCMQFFEHPLLFMFNPNKMVKSQYKNNIPWVTMIPQIFEP
jgi:hypothetical protein